MGSRGIICRRLSAIVDAKSDLGRGLLCWEFAPCPRVARRSRVSPVGKLSVIINAKSDLVLVRGLYPSHKRLGNWVTAQSKQTGPTCEVVVWSRAVICGKLSAILDTKNDLGWG